MTASGAGLGRGRGNYAMVDFTGTTGADSLSGTAGADSFDISQGGADTIKAGRGDDSITVGAALSVDDRIDGGGGQDSLVLDGDYSAGLTLGPDTVTGVEHFILVGGHDYDLSIANRTAKTAEGTLTVTTQGLTAADHIRIDASAVIDRSLTLAVSGGFVTLVGGTGSDTLAFIGEGEFSASAGAGDDTVSIDGPLARSARFDGGDGADRLLLITPQTARITAAMAQNFETIQLQSGGDWRLTIADGVAGTAGLLISANTHVGDHVFVDASAERDSSLTIYGGVEADTLIGGRGDDVIDAGEGDDLVTGGRGQDTLYNGLGADTFIYLTLADSKVSAPDHIFDIGPFDFIDLSAIDANPNKDGDQAFRQVEAFTHHRGELVVGAYLSETNETLVSVDLDGDANADMTISLSGDHSDFTGFVL